MPLTFTNLTQGRGYRLLIDGEVVDQEVHGKDFWQTDYDSLTRRWSQTFNVPIVGDGVREVRFERAE